MYALTTPVTLRDDMVNMFSAPPNATLSAETNYFVAFKALGSSDTAFVVRQVSSPDEDTPESGSGLEHSGWLPSLWESFREPDDDQRGGRARSSPIPNMAATGVPLIRGTVREGQELTVNTSGIADRNGLGGVRYGYQWIRVSGGGGADISGAMSRTYSVGADDVGERLQVRVEFTDIGGYAEERTSAVTAVVEGKSAVSFSAAEYWTMEGGAPALVVVRAVPAPLLEVVVPLRAEGQGGAKPPGLGADWGGVQSSVILSPSQPSVTLTVTARDDSVDDDGESVRISFRELPAGVVAGSLSVTTVHLDDNDVPPNVAPTGVPSISGMARVGQTLTADVSGIADGNGLDTPPGYEYQWVRVSDGGEVQISGATSQTLYLDGIGSGQGPGGASEFYGCAEV